MSETLEFDEQEFNDQEFEKEEAALFAGEDDAEIPESKGMKLVPSFRTIQFKRWFKAHYPTIGGAHNISRRDMKRYIREFEHDTGIPNQYTADDWIVSLRY